MGNCCGEWEGVFFKRKLFTGFDKKVYKVWWRMSLILPFRRDLFLKIIARKQSISLSRNDFVKSAQLDFERVIVLII